MDSKKIGGFIKERRLNRNLTQKDIAVKLSTSRENISKWERGIAIPNTEYLKELCEILQISIAELLAGSLNQDKEKIDEVIYDMIDAHQEFRKKVIKIFTTTVLTLLFIFLAYYFISNYNSIKLYRINGEQGEYIIKDSMLFISKEKTYMIFNGFIKPEDEAIKLVEMYYYKDDNKIKIYKSDEFPKIIIKDHIDHKDIIDNLFIEITMEDNTVIKFPINIRKDFNNDKLIENEDYELYDAVNMNTKETAFADFSYNEETGIYTYNCKKDGKEIKIEYDKFSEVLRAIESINNETNRWTYYGSKNKKLIYKSPNLVEYEYDINKKSCTHKECDSEIMIKINYFLSEYSQYLG